MHYWTENKSYFVKVKYTKLSPALVGTEFARETQHAMSEHRNDIRKSTEIMDKLS